MKQNDIPELSILPNENIENIFNVYQDSNKKYYYNLIQTIVFPQNLPDALFDLYVVKYGDTWPLISYKAYEDTKLWWIIAYANNVINPIEAILPETTLKIPKPNIIKEVLTQILTRNY